MIFIHVPSVSFLCVLKHHHRLTFGIKKTAVRQIWRLEKSSLTPAQVALGRSESSPQGFCWGFVGLDLSVVNHNTVDGRNPAPHGMYKTL